MWALEVCSWRNVTHRHLYSAFSWSLGWNEKCPCPHLQVWDNAKACCNGEVMGKWMRHWNKIKFAVWSRHGDVWLIEWNISRGTEQAGGSWEYRKLPCTGPSCLVLSALPDSGSPRFQGNVSPSPTWRCSELNLGMIDALPVSYGPSQSWWHWPEDSVQEPSLEPLCGEIWSRTLREIWKYSHVHMGENGCNGRIWANRKHIERQVLAEVQKKDQKYQSGTLTPRDPNGR